MIEKISVFESHSFDPYWNLAVEKYLLDTVVPNQCILYLWQNENTVVIGRNQNPWVECRTTLLEQEGGKLARRLSGGGAVFHDIGNLNFTFLVSNENYDVDRQLSVIQQACAAAGIAAEKSGRNDLLVNGCKFSGNAFYQSKTSAYHHGTLLVDVNMDKLSRYLSPSKAKLEAKGIQSVRSRVINLKELSNSLTVAKLKALMRSGLETVYGCISDDITIPESALNQIQLDANKNSSWDFLYGTPIPFTFTCEDRFSWGSVQLQLEAKNGIIRAAKLFSDAMDWRLPKQVERALIDCKFSLPAIESALQDTILSAEVVADFMAMLSKQAL